MHQPDNFDVVETLLDGENYQLYYASSGEQALNRLHSFQPDLILLDVMMPDLDGMEVCQRIKTDPHGLQQLNWAIAYLSNNAIIKRIC